MFWGSAAGLSFNGSWWMCWSSAEKKNNWCRLPLCTQLASSYWLSSRWCLSSTPQEYCLSHLFNLLQLDGQKWLYNFFLDPSLKEWLSCYRVFVIKSCRGLKVLWCFIFWHIPDDAKLLTYFVTEAASVKRIFWWNYWYETIGVFLCAICK